MIFGFLFLDILLWAVFPFILLCLLWGDQKGWATFVAIVVLGVVAFSTGFGTLWAMMTDPLLISTVLRNVAIYAGIGLGFTFLKWKVLTSKSAKEFAAYIAGKSFDPTDKNKMLPDVVDREVQRNREKAAQSWNDSYENHYRKVLSVVAKTGGGWTTKYQKLTLSEYVLSWTVYWPFYAILLVLDDLIRHIIDWFVEVFGKGFQKIADSSFANVN